MEKQCCYLCGSYEHQTRFRGVRDNPEISIVECTRCSLVSLFPGDNNFERHYEHSGMHGDNLPSIESWLLDTDHDDQRRIDMLKDSITNKKVLDFGSGAGGFLNKAGKVASEVVGVEQEIRVQKFWKEELQLYGNLHDVDTDFDLITAFHVIEHLHDPIVTLKELATHLSDDGQLIIEVPNSEDALFSLYDCTAFKQFSYWSQHIFLFNAETLRQLAKQAGLSIVAIKQYQRYPLSNHLHWLSCHKPGGHKTWSFLNSSVLNEAYSDTLASVGKCDTLIAYLRK